MRNEITALAMLILLAFLLSDISILQSGFELSEILVSLTFSLVFTFAIGLEVVKEHDD